MRIRPARLPIRRALTRRLPAIPVLAAIAALAASVLPAPAASARVSHAAAASSGNLWVNYDFMLGASTTFFFPDTPPPGADNFSCHPSAAHPYPVVLVNGTFANMNDNWQAASPLLYNHGYCVFAFNYGGSYPSDPVQGTGEIAASAQQLAAFVSKVLAATGAAKVDLVGHSQGGMMPRYYINFLGGSAVVDKLVALAPSNYGTTLNGLVTLASTFNTLAGINGLVSPTCTACVEQESGSAFLAKLNATPTVPAVRYTVIESTGDEVVTPYTNAFLPAAPNVTNITVNDQCSADHTDHVEIAADPVALADVLNALDPAHPVTVPCVTVLPLTGPVGPVPSF
jgi:triacylglycerol esterase/lipase EstA (alpha/beta hydrolase family)